jgi:hypothetical protein
MSQAGADDYSERGLVSIPYLTYQQTASVFGGVAILFFLTHFFGFEWHGFLVVVAGVWNETMRPFMKWVLDNSVTPILKWVFGWSFYVPLVARDYVSVGFILFLSIVRARADMIYVYVPLVPNLGIGRRRVSPFNFPLMLLMMLAWPLYIVGLLEGIRMQASLAKAFENDPSYPEAPKRYRKRLYRYAISLSPLIYALGLLTINYTLLR